MGRIRSCEKYLTAEEVFRARWLRREAMAKDPGWDAREIGIAYIADVLQGRSGVNWIEEKSAVAKGLPTEMDYATAHWGSPTSDDFAQARRLKFKILEAHCEAYRDGSKLFDGLQGAGEWARQDRHFQDQRLFDF